MEFDAKDAKVARSSIGPAESRQSREALRLTGWNKNSALRPGDVISIYVAHGPDGRAPAGRLTKVVLADGTTLGDTQGNAVPPISRGGGGNGDY